MKNLFPGYYKIDYDNLFKNSTFVFDTNILLSLYRLPKREQESLLNLLEKIKRINKLWVPYQIAEEYHNNIYNEIVKQKKSYNEILEIISLKDVIKKLEDNYLNKHPTINIEEIINRINNFKTSTINIIENSRNDHYLPDDLKEKIANIFESVGESIEECDKNNLFKIAEERFKKKIPPGFNDKYKDDNKYGDFIIWYLMKEYSKKYQKSIIFITNDKKDDWWLKINGEMRPHPLLINEFLKDTKQNFYMYTLDNFIKYVEKYFDVKPENLTKIPDMLNFFEDNYNKNVSNNKANNYKKKVVEKRYSKTFIIKAINTMKEWFYSNYVDPAEICPYDSSEGGYQFICGGPYEIEDELYKEFCDKYEENIIKKASKDILDKTGIIEWSKYEKS